MIFTADATRDLRVVISGDASGAENAILQMSSKVNEGAMVAAGAFVAVGAAVTAATVYAVNSAADFQKAMTLIQTQAGSSADEVNNMSKALLDLAPAMGTTPQKLAEGLFYVESAGFRGAKALDILKLAAEGAAVGHADLAKTADVLTSVINSGIGGIKNETEAMGALNAIVGGGKMHFDDLIGAMGTGILPMAKAVGISIQDVGAALDVMTNNGIPAIDGATRLRMTLSLMETPTTKAKQALESIGISSNQLANDMRSGGLMSAITDLNTHLNGVAPASTSVVKGTKMSVDALDTLKQKISNTQTQLKILNEEHVKSGVATDKHNLAITKAQQTLEGYQEKLGGANKTITSLGGATLDATAKAQLLTEAFGGARSGAIMELLVQNMDQLGTSLNHVKNTAGNFQEAWAKTQEDFGFQIEKMKGTVSVLAIEFGNKLLPILTKVAEWINNNLIPGIQKLTKFFHEHKLILEIVAGVIGGLLLFGLIALASTIGGVISAIVAFATSMVPIIGVSVGVAAVIGGVLVTAFLIIKDHLKQIITIVENVGKFFKDVWDNIVVIVDGVVKWFGKNVAPVLKDIFEVIKFALIVLWDVFVTYWYAIWHVAVKPYVDLFTNYVLPVLEAVWSGIKSGLKVLGDIFKTIWESIKVVVGAVVDWFSSTIQPKWSSIWKGIKTTVSEVVNDIIGLVKTMVNFVLDSINTVTGAANKVGSHIPGFVNIPQIPHLASGSDYFSGGMALVGERGPELVNLPQGSSVTPTDKTKQMMGNTVNIYNPQISNNMDINNIIRQIKNALGRENELARMAAI